MVSKPETQLEKSFPMYWNVIFTNKSYAFLNMVKTFGVSHNFSSASDFLAYNASVNVQQLRKSLQSVWFLWLVKKAACCIFLYTVLWFTQIMHMWIKIKTNHVTLSKTIMYWIIKSHTNILEEEEKCFTLLHYSLF